MEDELSTFYHFGENSKMVTDILVMRLNHLTEFPETMRDLSQIKIFVMQEMQEITTIPEEFLRGNKVMKQLWIMKNPKLTNLPSTLNIPSIN